MGLSNKFNVMYLKKKKVFSLSILLILLLISVSISLYFVEKQGTYFDEPLYVQAGDRFNSYIQEGNYSKIIHEDLNPEHPSFIKFFYGGLFYIFDVDSEEDRIYIARLSSVFFSSIIIVLLYFINPFASIFFILNKWSHSFAALAMFEMGYVLFALLGVFFLNKALKDTNFRFLLLSGVFFGLGMASKYLTAVIIIASLPFIFKNKFKDTHNLMFLVVLVLSFFIFNPVIWDNPIIEVKDSLLFHEGYSTSEENDVFPWYQNISYLYSRPNDYNSLYGIEFYPIFFIIGLLGLPFLFKENRIIFSWFCFAIIFLLLYPVRWVQYSFIAIVPMCVSSGYLISAIAKKIMFKFGIDFKEKQ